MLAHINDERELKIALTGLLYRRCLRHLWLCAPGTEKLPELLQAADNRERLIVPYLMKNIAYKVFIGRN
ncbi:MAG: hypothetical protein GXY49_08665 [Syntrophomonadaceae bacterium]|nr:hypothetical protein [Syntrophomonadaceae bacterium]